MSKGIYTIPSNDEIAEIVNNVHLTETVAQGLIRLHKEHKKIKVVTIRGLDLIIQSILKNDDTAKPEIHGVEIFTYRSDYHGEDGIKQYMDSVKTHMTDIDDEVLLDSTRSLIVKTTIIMNGEELQYTYLEVTTLDGNPCGYIQSPM